MTPGFIAVVKETVSVTSSNPSYKDGNVRFTTVTLNDLINKVCIRTPCFCFEICISGFSAKVTNGLDTFWVRKRKYLPHFWSDKGFKGTIVNRVLSLNLPFCWNVSFQEEDENNALMRYSPTNPHPYLTSQFLNTSFFYYILTV